MHSVHAPRLRQGVAARAQGSAQADQRQADEARRVVALDALTQAYPEAFTAQRSGAVERFVSMNIGLDFGLAQRTQVNGGEIEELSAVVTPQAHDRYSAVKLHAAARLVAQLHPGLRGVPRLVEYPALAGSDLVRPDHHPIRVAQGHRPGLGKGQAGCTQCRRLLWQGCLIEPWRACLEGQAQPAQELLAVPRGGSENESGRCGHEITRRETRA